MSGTCGICGGALTLLHPGTTDALPPGAFSPTCHETGLHGDLFRCTSCGTVQQPSLPAGADLVDLYREMDDAGYLAEEAGRRRTAQRLLALVSRHTGRGRLLEVGCGHGLLLDEARRAGWEVLGVEPSSSTGSYARDVLGLDVRDATVEQLDPAVEGRFSAIVMADVIEHLDDPAGVVRACRDLLEDGGVLLVVTPDPDSRTARLAGARWWGFLPAHTFLLPRRTLRALLAGEGLEVVDDSGLRRTFSLAYWMAGLGERSGGVGRALGALGGTPAGRVPVTLSLGDERVVIARRRAATRAAS